MGTLSNTPILPPPRPLIRQVPKELTLASWNIDAFTSRPTSRDSQILGSPLERSKVPDIVFFQEVRRDVYDFLLHDERVREGFFATDAEDQTAFDGVPFTTVMLLSRTRFIPGNLEKIVRQEGCVEDAQILLRQAGRMKLPSKYGRDGLFIDINCGTDGAIRLVNVHLDSLSGAFDERSQQIAILTRNLRENRYDRGLIVGDFNAISLEDHKLLDKHGLRETNGLRYMARSRPVIPGELIDKAWTNYNQVDWIRSL